MKDDPMESPPIAKREPSIVLTRRHWACYFFPTTVLAALIGAIVFARTGATEFLTAPVLPIFMWLWLHNYTPVGGMRGQRFLANPFYWRILCWGAIHIALIIGLAATLDERFHLFAMGSISVVFMIGVCYLAYRFGPRRKPLDQKRPTEP